MISHWEYNKNILALKRENENLHYKKYLKYKVIYFIKNIKLSLYIYEMITCHTQKFWTIESSFCCATLKSISSDLSQTGSHFYNLKMAEDAQNPCELYL